MLYMTVKLVTVILIYKIISIGPFIASASTLVMPLWFVMGDIIAEVYGYKVARQLIWSAILCQFLFAFTCGMLNSFHSPSGWGDQEAYNQVLGKLPRVAFASFLAILSGAFVNAYSISKWKIFFRGKYFWLRCLGASAIGEFIFTIVAYSTEFFGLVSSSHVVHLIVISYVIKIIFGLILILPAMYIAEVLKKAESIDPYDYLTSFNPFSLSLENKI